jgi:hypothetical protein
MFPPTGCPPRACARDSQAWSSASSSCQGRAYVTPDGHTYPPACTSRRRCTLRLASRMRYSDQQPQLPDRELRLAGHVVQSSRASVGAPRQRQARRASPPLSGRPACLITSKSDPRPGIDCLRCPSSILWMSAVCRLEDRRCELLQRRATNPSLKLSLSRLPGRLRPPRRRRVPFSGVTSARPPRPHPPHWPSYLPKPAFSLLFSRL